MRPFFFFLVPVAGLMISFFLFPVGCAAFFDLKDFCFFVRFPPPSPVRPCEVYPRPFFLESCFSVFPFFFFLLHSERTVDSIQCCPFFFFFFFLAAFVSIVTLDGPSFLPLFFWGLEFPGGLARSSGRCVTESFLFHLFFFLGLGLRLSPICRPTFFLSPLPESVGRVCFCFPLIAGFFFFFLPLKIRSMINFFPLRVGRFFFPALCASRPPFLPFFSPFPPPAELAWSSCFRRARCLPFFCSRKHLWLPFSRRQGKLSRWVPSTGSYFNPLPFFPYNESPLHFPPPFFPAAQRIL